MTPNGRARAVALAVAAAADYRPTAAVSFRSQGRLLIVGAGHQAREAVSRLAPALNAIVLLLPEGAQWPDAGPVPGNTSGGSNLVVLHATPKSISGYLGKFDVVLSGPEGDIGLGDLAASAHWSQVDLVLDLSAQPFISSETAPAGYFAPRDDDAGFERALAEIPALVGEFEQPQYVRSDPDICAHSRSGIAACSRCLDACSDGADRKDRGGSWRCRRSAAVPGKQRPVADILRPRRRAASVVRQGDMDAGPQVWVVAGGRRRPNVANAPLSGGTWVSCKDR